MILFYVFTTSLVITIAITTILYKVMPSIMIFFDWFGDLIKSTSAHKVIILAISIIILTLCGFFLVKNYLGHLL